MERKGRRREGKVRGRGQVGGDKGGRVREEKFN